MIDAITLATAIMPVLMDPIAEKAWELLKNRLIEARKEYKAKPIEELSFTIETNRRERLDKLSELQARVILEVPDANFLKALLAMSLELTAEAYEANIDEELDAIQRRSNQLNSFLDRDANDRRQRKRVRIVAVLISVSSFVGLFALAILGSRYDLEVDYVIPVLQIPMPVLLWSAIGSFTSLLYRFNKASDIELQDPLRWLVTRPLTGIVMGTVVYLVIRAGFLSTGVVDLLPAETNELIWLVAFLVGFSDRFSESLLKSLVGRLGGDKDTSLLTPSSMPTRLSVAELLQPLSTIRKKITRGISEIDVEEPPAGSQPEDSNSGSVSDIQPPAPDNDI